MVFCPITQFTFPHTFSIQFLTGIIPTQAVYPEMSVRSLVFGKIMTTCCPNRLLFYNTNIRYSIITKHPLYNSISSLLLKRPANRSTTIPFVPLWHHTDTVLSVKYRQYLSNHFQRWNCSVSRFYNCSTAIPSKSPQNRF